MSDILKKLRVKRQELLKKLNGMTEKADNENRDFSEGEDKDFNEMEAELKTVDARIQRNARLESYEADGSKGSSSRAIYEQDGDEEEKASEEEKAAEEEAEEKRSAKGKGKEQRKAGPWSRLGDQLMAVMRAGLPGGSIDSRLVQVRDVSGANETIPSQGGFLVQPEFANELLKATYEQANLASLCKRIPLRGNSHKINAVDETSRATGSRLGGVQVYWTSEGGTVTPSKPKLRQISLNLHKLMGLSYITEEEMEDAPAMESLISQSFPEEMAFILDDSIVRGSGAGQPLGFLNSPSLVTVAKESSQSTATVIDTNIFNMRSRLYPRGRKNSVWLINQDIEPNLFAMKLGDLGIYFPGGSFANEPDDKLMGRPVHAIEQASTLGTVGDIMLVDLSQYVLAEKAAGGVKSATSVHVRFAYDEMAFKFTYRVDGQPVWNLPLTPYKGSATKSPFVTLATRP